MSIRPEQKEQVRQATDLVRLVGEHVKLAPKGREFVGLCPFHEDRSPSMYVVPQKQMYHCFVCGASGDPIGWMINYHKMAFPEAVRFLADRAGIVLDEDNDPQSRQKAQQATDERKLIQQANEQAMDFFQKALASDKASDIRKYIQDRGISDAMVEAFSIGYAPDDWTAMAQYARRQNWSIKGLEAAHLCRKRQDGSAYDFFRHRLMFPVLDALNRPIAFGGRKLKEEDNPKYINSPEHRLFNKSATLYGIHRAKKPIMDRRAAVIVEGYTDVIACHQAGADNAVATLGTALTQQHVRELRKYADEIILVFDGDAAGQKAADRALELFLNESLDVKLCVLPGGKDPADFLADEGIDAWNDATKNAEDALSYQFRSVREKLDASTTLTARQRLLDDYIDTLLSMGMTHTGPFRTAYFVKRLHELSGVSEAELAALIREREAKAKQNQRFAERAKQAAPAPAASKQQASANHSARPANTAPPASSVDSIDPSLIDPDYDPAFASEPPAPYDDAHTPEINPSAGSPDQNTPNTFSAHTPLSASGARASKLAELQLLGGLIQDNQLFDLPMQDGVPIEEAIPADALPTPNGQALYSHITEAIIAEQAVSIGKLLSDLIEIGKHDQVSLATQADKYVQNACEDKPELRREMVQQAAEAIRRFADAADTPDERPAHDADPLDKARRLKAMISEQRLSPTPHNIGRIRNR